MDDIVKQALVKWPNVPDCYGWLGLDARGNWYMRDDRAQAAGPFSAAAGGNLQSKGSLLRHEKLIDFIGRNYLSDASGQWFFQNGPQRVFVELDSAPWVWRLGPDSPNGVIVTSHTGVTTQVQSCVLDELGHVYLNTDLGFGLVHTQDVEMAATQIELGRWQPQDLRLDDISVRFRFISSPKAVLNQNNG